MIAVGYGWMNDAARTSPQQRAIITICMNMFGQTSTAFTSVLVWKTVEAPRFLKGFTFTASCAFSLIPISFLILTFYKRDERRAAHENGIIIYNSKKGEAAPEILADGTVIVNDGEGRKEYRLASYQSERSSAELVLDSVSEKR